MRLRVCTPHRVRAHTSLSRCARAPGAVYASTLWLDPCSKVNRCLMDYCHTTPHHTAPCDTTPPLAHLAMCDACYCCRLVCGKHPFFMLLLPSDDGIWSRNIQFDLGAVVLVGMPLVVRCTAFSVASLPRLRSTATPAQNNPHRDMKCVMCLFREQMTRAEWRDVARCHRTTWNGRVVFALPIGIQTMGLYWCRWPLCTMSVTSTGFDLFGIPSDVPLLPNIIHLRSPRRIKRR